jgi:hypothetical protein
MDDLGQRLPGSGVADIMGQLEIFHLGPILIAAFGGPQIYAYFYAIYYVKLSIVKLLVVCLQVLAKISPKGHLTH